MGQDFVENYVSLKSFDLIELDFLMNFCCIIIPGYLMSSTNYKIGCSSEGCGYFNSKNLIMAMQKDLIVKSYFALEEINFIAKEVHEDYQSHQNH